MQGRDIFGLMGLALVLAFATGAIARGGQTSQVAQALFDGFNNTLGMASGQTSFGFK